MPVEPKSQMDLRMEIIAKLLVRGEAMRSDEVVREFQSYLEKRIAHKGKQLDVAPDRHRTILKTELCELEVVAAEFKRLIGRGGR